MIPIETAPYFVAVSNELKHTTAQVVWHARHANYAVVASAIPQYAPWYHLFIEIDGEWVLSESSFSGWLAYNIPDLKGVFVGISPVNPQVSGGRVVYCDQVIESQVHEGYLCTVIWDIDIATQQDKLNYQELLIDGNWQKCIVAWSPVTAQQFAEAYLQYYRSETRENKDENYWAVDMLFTDDREEKLNLALAIIDYADLERDESGLGSVGAGPLEDLMSEWLLDRLENIIPKNLKLKYALRMVRMEFEEENLQQRLAGLLR